jgi:hypothetical protein
MQESLYLIYRTAQVNTDIKPKPNHGLYLSTLRKMTAAQRLAKSFELSNLTKELFLSGLRNRFPAKSEGDIKKIYLERIARCHNRNY